MTICLKLQMSSFAETCLHLVCIHSCWFDDFCGL